MRSPSRHAAVQISISEYLQMNFVAFAALSTIYAAVDAGTGALYPYTPVVLLSHFAMTSAVAGWCLLLTRLMLTSLSFIFAGILGGTAIVFGIGVVCGTIPAKWIYAIVVAAMVAAVFGCVFIYFLIRSKKDEEELNEVLRRRQERKHGSDRA